MEPSKRRPIFFLSGIFGLAFCVCGWFRWHQLSWLFGVSICTYLVVVSTGEAYVATKNDLKELRRRRDINAPGEIDIQNRGLDSSVKKPLRQNPYFRAGIMGLPFCIFEWFWKHDFRFLLGGGFFAGILLPPLYQRWKQHHATPGTNSAASTDK